MAEDKKRLVAIPRLPGLKPDTPSNSSSATMSTTSTGASSSNDTNAKHSPSVKHEYDVYAKPFIPSALRAINYEAGLVATKDEAFCVDFKAYTEYFTGKSFIPDRSVPPIPLQHTSVSHPSHTLSETSYLDYFLALFNIEREAKERENENYSLYKVPLQKVSWPDGHTLYSLLIPGLREDSPLIEKGDMIQLRQLWIDRLGNLVVVPEQVGDPRFHPPILRTWTGVIYNAAVFAVNRAQEMVYLKISGLKPTTMVFNVVLPLKQRQLRAQWCALSHVNQELQKTYYTNTGLSQLSMPASPYHVNGDDNKQEEKQSQNDWIRRMLFPEEIDGVVQTQLRKIPGQRGLFDHNINYEQLQAVNSGCENEFGILPFLISGPPGTGKTKTLVEIALQLLNTTSVAHILICAPSDQAADTLATRLRKHLTPKQLLRLNGPQRADIEVPQEILPYCYMEQDMFFLPPFRQLMAYNIVVTSTRDAAILADARLTNIDLYLIEKDMRSAFHPEHHNTPQTLHWGALLMDEAAQATELDALPALSIIMPPSSYSKKLEQPRFIMAGDQNQLGPRTASRNPQFSTSLLARLFDRPIYKNHPLSRSNVRPSAGPPIMTASMLPMLYPPFVNLIRNYRSHPAILSVPSNLFYNDTLIPEMQPESTPLQTSPLWQGRKWPVLYVSHTGPDELERDGGGWYNITEARHACGIAQLLIISSGVSQADIVIMSPFAAQVKLLRRMIRSSNYGGGSGLWDVNIGPLEAFQGLESRVVIICTTRTRERFLDMDAERGLGIVGQKRKMNVALTRAKMGLIVIGSPTVLARDEHWRAWLAFCWRNGLVAGESMPFDENMISSFKGCKIGVLEKALLVKEQSPTGTRMLGSAAVAQDEDEDEMWTAGLQAALEDYGSENENEGEENDHDAYDGETEGDEGNDATDSSGPGMPSAFPSSVIGHSMHMANGTTSPV